MKLPSDMIERDRLYRELVRQCTVSRQDRFNFYQTARNYYLFGSATAGGAPYNKIGSTIDTLSSFIYSPDAIRFSIQLGTEAPRDEVFKAVPLAREVTEQWRVSRTHVLFGMGLRWANVFGIMLLKLMWKNNRVRSYLVEPHQFGVLLEDIIEMPDQEAFTHHYTITRTQLEAELQGNPRKASIMQRAGRTDADSLPPISSGMSRLLLGSPVGGVPGSLAIPGSSSGIAGGMAGQGGGPQYDYAPRIEVDLIDMVDLYVWSDELEDFQVVTRAAPDVTIYDRPSSWLGHIKGVPPFTVIRPELNLYDYFFGASFAARLTWLQDWRTERVLDVKKIMAKQVKPPWTITGGVGITEEKMASLHGAGGLVSFPSPATKATQHPPTMPADIFAEIAQIDAMFDDQAGIGHVLQGKGEPGVRSRGQADLMARLGSSRPKERAVAVEESAEEAAGQILHLVQDHSEQRFVAAIQTPDGSNELPFTAEQFTKDYEVKVDAHSSSPIFVEDRKHDAVTMLEAKAIDRETFLDMMDPPNLQDLKERLKRLEKAEAEDRKMELQMGISPGGKAKKGKHP